MRKSQHNMCFRPNIEIDEGSVWTGIARILNNLGLERLIKSFNDNKVGQRDVLHLTDEEFGLLGVTSIGDRARIREMCRAELNETLRESPVVAKFRTLNRNKAEEHKAFAQGKKSSKTTKRVYIGWKHQFNEKRGFQPIFKNKGGGAEHMDLKKELSLQELTEEICKVYFPGKPVEEFLHVNQEFNLEKYCMEIACSPIRIYLHTAPKIITEQPDAGNVERVNTHGSHRIRLGLNRRREEISDDDDLPEIAQLTDKASRINTDIHPDLTISTSSDRLTLDNTLESQNDNPLPSCSGTPTISFNCNAHGRNRLTLKRRGATDGMYRSYVGLFQSDDLQARDSSENEEDSDTNSEIHSESAPNITEILKQIRAQLNLQESCRFNISRADVLDGFRRGIRRKTLNPKKKMSVKFTDDFGNSEGAVDQGGPTRELLRLAIRKIQTAAIFEGPMNARKLTLNSSGTALADGLYDDVGKMFVMSIIHGGPCPQFLSRVTYYVLVGLPVNPTTEHIEDEDVRSQVQELSKCESMEDVNRSLEIMSPILALSGCQRPIRNITETQRLVQDLVHFLVIGRLKGCMLQLSSGLEILGFLEKLREYPEVFEELFIEQKENLNSTTLELIFYDIKFSEEGSNQRVAEERILGYWRDFLIDIEDFRLKLKLTDNKNLNIEYCQILTGLPDYLRHLQDLQQIEEDAISLLDVLVFATGSDAVPPLGFEPTPSISFQHESGHLYPTANTCGMVLNLPTISMDYPNFKKNMIFGIANSPGLGNA